MSVTVESHKNFVGGEWVDSTSGETMEVLNPATGDTIAEVPRGSQEDVDRAVAAAKQALPARFASSARAGCRSRRGRRGSWTSRGTEAIAVVC